MKRGLILCLAMTVLCGCHQRKPRYTDAQMQKFHAELPWMTDACFDQLRSGGIESVNGDCTKRLPAMRWRGLWRRDFEGSLFCPAPAQECTNQQTPTSKRVWLQLNPEPSSLKDVAPGGLYAIEFIGRRSSKGSFEQAYGYEQDMIVDRLISIRQVEAPPPLPTKAEVEAWGKACHANHTCVDVKGLNGPKSKTK